MIETDRQYAVDELIADQRFGQLLEGAGEVEVQAVSPLMKHVLSHRNIFARFVTIRIRQASPMLGALLCVPLDEVDRYAVSRLTEMFLERE